MLGTHDGTDAGTAGSTPLVVDDRGQPTALLTRLADAGDFHALAPPASGGPQGYLEQVLDLMGVLPPQQLHVAPLGVAILDA
jgi:hypothetical protein